MRKFILLICYLTTSSVAFSQDSSAKVLRSYKLEKSIQQDGGRIKFWRSATKGEEDKILIEAIKNKRDSILFNDFVRDGRYIVADKNFDGYKDFVLFYHDYEEIYFYDRKKHSFATIPYHLPSKTFLIDTPRKIMCGYRDAQYSEPYDYSILYSFKRGIPYYYYKLIYKTQDRNESKDESISIDLYKLNKGIYDSSTFVKTITTRNCKSFSYLSFWKINWNKLVGNR